MNADKQFVHLVSDGWILAAAPVTADCDEALRTAVAKMAYSHSTAYWVSEAEDGEIARYRVADAAHVDGGAASTAYEVVVRSGVPFEAKEHGELMVSERLERFWISVVSVEHAYDVALNEFGDAVAGCSPRDAGATHRLQELYSKLLEATRRAAEAHPTLTIDARKEASEVLKESAWELSGNIIVSRVAEIFIGAITDVFKWKGRDVLQFKFRTHAAAPGWKDAFAFVTREGDTWKVMRERSWLQERKRQFEVNSAQIDFLYDLVEDLGIKGR